MYNATLTILSDSDIEQIHRATLRVLWETGVLIKDPEARMILKREGARVDEEAMKVYIPPYLVESAVGLAPETFTLYGRDPANKYVIDRDTLYYEPMIGRLYIYDYDTGSIRRTSLEDVGHLVRVADAMPNYHLLHSGAIMPEIQGVPIGTSHAQ